MRARLAAPWVVLVSIVTLASPSRAQCVPLGPPFSSGCGPGGLPPSLVCAGLPVLGSSLCLSQSLQGCQIPASLFFLMVATCPSTPPPFPPLPLILCPAGPAGCSLAVDPAAAALFGTVTLPGCTWLFFLPPDPSLSGITLCVQSFSLLLCAPGPPCVALTNGLQITLL